MIATGNRWNCDLLRDAPRPERGDFLLVSGILLDDPCSALAVKSTQIIEVLLLKTGHTCTSLRT